LSDKRIIAGWAIAPLAAFVFWGSWTIIAIPFFYLAVLGIGVPIFDFCESRRWVKWWHAILAGLLAGGVLGAIWFLGADHVEVESARLNPYALLPPYLSLPAYGASVGLLFWCIAIYRNPKVSSRAQNDA
jgi:hypothetical protein